MWDDFDNNEDDWDEEDDFDPRKEYDKIYKHPLMKKAKDILGLTRALVGSLDEARKELYGGIMMEDCMILSAKFAGAQGVKAYSLKMEMAVLMKIHAKNLASMTYQLEIEETHAQEHLNLLREAVEDYRILFLEWIADFEKDKNYDDGWGIFTD